MKKECVEQPITFPVPVFRRLSAFQQSKKISLEGIVLPVLEKLLPKTEDAGEATFPEGFFVQSPEGSGESVRRLLEIPFPLMARLVEYRKTRQLSLEDIIVPILDRGLPKRPSSATLINPLPASCLGGNSPVLLIKPYLPLRV